MNLIKLIPNLLTLSNLFCGFLGLIFIYSGQSQYAGLMILIAALMDFLDGFAAKMLKAQSAIGQQLDSLADMVSFGVLPGFILYDMLSRAAYYEPWLSRFKTGGANSWPMLAFVFTACVAIRLAVFNTDDKQKTQFKGVPSPAAALFIAGIPLVYFWGLNLTPFDAQQVQDFYLNPFFLLAANVLLGLLMVNRIPFFSLKMNNLKFKPNAHIYILLLLSILLLFFFKLMAINLIIALYIIFSIVLKITKKHEI